MTYDPNKFRLLKRPLTHRGRFEWARYEYDVVGDSFSLTAPLFSVSNDLNDFALSAQWHDRLLSDSPFASLPAGWKWGFDRYMKLNQDGSFTLYDANGKTHDFVRPLNDSTAPSGVYFDPSGARRMIDDSGILPW